MRIRRLEIKNFRQFYGECKLEFLSDDKSRITVIHGENGSGKTSLLNAFKWVLYGKTDFDTGEETILNELALSESSPDGLVELRLCLEFDHKESKYTVSRKQEFKRIGESLKANPIGGSVADLSWINHKGEYKTVKNAANHINQSILPEQMHSYFFFNGERIEKLANVSAAGEIRDAIKTLMGLEIISRASDHLKRLVIRDLRSEAKETASDEYRGLLERQERIDTEIRKHQEDKGTATESNRGFENEIKTIEARLSEIQEARILTERRSNLQSEKERLKEELETLNKNRLERISQSGALAFLLKPSKHVQDMLEECRKKGELPYKLRQTFIDDLLDSAKCICGTELPENSEARSTLKIYRNDATEENLESACIDVVSDLRAMPRERNKLYEQLKRWSVEETESNSRLRAITEELDQISSKLGSSEIESVEKLEACRRNYKESLIGERTKIKKAEEAIEAANKNRSELYKEIEKVRAKSEAEKRAKQELEFAEECKNLVDNIHEALAEDTRCRLSMKVNDTFQNILRKDFYAEIDDDYTLKIFKDIPEVGKQPVLEKSTGENQVVSLSFIASLVSLTKERNRENASFLKGGVYPLVMDSPFGALDREYREKVAQHIPDLADQVIIFASNSQWSKEVDNKCRPFIGKEYSLVYHAPKSEGREVNTDYVILTDGPEFTKIKEGYLGH
ncbi:MAG: AAA family ATPase [Aestuariivita sp.]|nr:AAA family ATPase [Aestuariivita sp.]MCY4346904.1 AAA family ATPase [Aestuariivita sp.]